MEDEKTYMWLALITFFALLAAIGFAALELSDLKNDQLFKTENPFGG